MKRIRAKFIKDSNMKFLSHLDILRTFNRALRRGNIPVVYSQGFNPHPSMSFALPLSVGVTSEGEYVDIDIEDSITSDELKTKINMALPEGLKVVNADEVDSKSNIMAIIKSAKYKVVLNGNGFSNFKEKTNDMLSRESIEVEKETKKGKNPVDIKPAIENIEVKAYDDLSVEMIMTLNAGSQSNLKPDAVIKAMEKYLDIYVSDINIHRIELIY